MEKTSPNPYGNTEGNPYADVSSKTTDQILAVVKQYMQSGGFVDRKITDSPNDSLQVVPRKYVTRYATTLLRPVSSILGESYFDTTVKKPVWWNGVNYQDAAGNVIS